MPKFGFSYEIANKVFPRSSVGVVPIPLALARLARIKRPSRSLAKMRAVWDNSGDGYLWLDQEFRFVGCNPAAVDLFGCASDAELLGKTPLDFSPEVQPDGTSSVERESA